MSSSNEQIKARAAVDGTVSRVSLAARCADCVIALVSCGLAARCEYFGSHLWAAMWASCAAFCVYTAITGPVDKIWAFVNRKLLGRAAQPKPLYVHAAAPAPVNRQQRRQQARQQGKN